MDDAEPEGRAPPMDYTQRVKAEAADLKPMIDRLSNFVNGASFESVHPEEQQLLKTQLGQMQGYYNTLNARVKFHEGQA